MSKIDLKIKIIHDGEVNRARAMPQNPVRTHPWIYIKKNYVSYAEEKMI